MSNLHQILLHPTDVLFFRDGRPMSGSLAGHTVTWPLPDVPNHALLAALHRAGLENLHKHVPGRSSQSRDYSDENRANNGRLFGALRTAGPFPVNTEGKWFFSRPMDAQKRSATTVTLRPVHFSGSRDGNAALQNSSLPFPLRYAVANTEPPTKEGGGEHWVSRNAFERTLRLEQKEGDPSNHDDFLKDSDVADVEPQIGIAIDSGTGTTGLGDAAGKIYAAHYLRLRDGMSLGVFAEAMDKVEGNSGEKRDLIRKLLKGQPTSIVVGGQQRLCSASRADINGALPLPQGLRSASQFRTLYEGKVAVKWVLLTPAIWPAMEGEGIEAHSGGWIPNWVSQDRAKPGAVMLKSGDTSRRSNEGREAWRERVRGFSSIDARLVAAVVPKAIHVTGWALPDGHERKQGGAKPTHLAVPAGAVYYFEADSQEDAVALATALNWHGSTLGTEIRNRRSTLLGEKGYGLGVCGTWSFYQPQGEVR